MSEKPDEDQPRVAVGRRRVMARMGAGGLATAIAVFARTSSASAAPANYACCNLAHYPPTIDYNACLRVSGHYVWSCTRSGGGYCECCETPGDAQSGAACFSH